MEGIGIRGVKRDTREKRGDVVSCDWVGSKEWPESGQVCIGSGGSAKIRQNRGMKRVKRGCVIE